VFIKNNPVKATKGSAISIIYYIIHLLNKNIFDVFLYTNIDSTINTVFIKIALVN